MTSFEDIQKANLAKEVREAVRLLQQLTGDMDILTTHTQPAHPPYVADYLVRTIRHLKIALRDAGELEEVEA